MNATVHSLTPKGLKDLALNGASNYRLVDDQVDFYASEIINNRSRDNTSGTLSLELWALPMPYQGGDFSGIPLAGREFGTLQGQHSLRNLTHSQRTQLPGEGEWYLVLMLREYTGNGYVTRDYMNYPETLKAAYKLALSL